MKANKESFLKRINNPERVFLLQKENSDLYLIADMEIVDEDICTNTIRTERMCFLLNNESDFMYDVVECRCRYCGGIYIDDNENKSTEQIYSEFISADEYVHIANYFILQNDSVKNISRCLEEGFNYIIVN